MNLPVRRPTCTTVTVLAAVIALAFSSAAAWALFSSSSFTATATNTAGVLPTPTVSGTSSSSTVSLALGNGGGTITPLSYTLSASPAGGTGTGGTCQASLSPPTLPTTCTYTGVASGTYTYTLTAVYNSWTHATTSSPVTVVSGPTFVGSSGPVAVTSTTNNVVLSYPANTAAGDLIFAVIVNGANQDSTAPTGWTQLGNPNGNNLATCAQSQFELQVFWHVAAAGETSVTMPSIHTNAAGATMWLVSYGGIPSPAVNGTPSTGLLPAALTFVAPNITTTAANTTVFAFAAVCAANTLSLSVPLGFTQNFGATHTPGTQGGGVAVATSEAPLAGLVSLPTWSQPGLAEAAYITAALT